MNRTIMASTFWGILLWIILTALSRVVGGFILYKSAEQGANIDAIILTKFLHTIPAILAVAFSSWASASKVLPGTK